MQKYLTTDLRLPEEIREDCHRDYFEIYKASEADALVARLKWEHEQIESAQRDIQAAKDARIAELRGALADIALSKDMTIEVARAKAKRIYEQTS